MWKGGVEGVRWKSYMRDREVMGSGEKWIVRKEGRKTVFHNIRVILEGVCGGNGGRKREVIEGSVEGSIKCFYEINNNKKQRKKSK